MTPPAGQRLPLVDLLKAAASQLIVLHHLAFYGPMSDRVAEFWPALMSALSQHGRLAVQVFLVIGGFLAARQLAPAARWAPAGSPGALLRERYLRLVLPYAAALALALLCTALARRWMKHASLPEPAGAWELLLHLLLLQDLLGVDAISAGVWYLAIDFQLFALLAGLLWLAARLEARCALRRPLAPGLLALGVATSLLHFNREPAWDVAAPYFFGAYGLGVLAAWWTAAPRGPRVAWAAGVVALIVLALLLEFRARIALAALAALALAVAGTAGQRLRGAGISLVEALGRISYALFLVHFGVCLLVNALFTRFLPPDAAVQGLGLALAWAASLGAAWLFHRGVERPALRWAAARRRRGASALAAG